MGAGMRERNRIQSPDAFWHLVRHDPRDDCTPVVTDKVKSIDLEGVCDVEHILRQEFDLIVLDSLGSRTL